MPEETDELTFEMTLNVRDYEAYFTFMSHRPRRLLLNLAMSAAAALWYLAVTIAIRAGGALFNPDGGGLAGLRAYLATDLWPDLAAQAPWILGLCAGLLGLNLLVLTPLQCRRLARRTLRSDPAVRRDDPDLAFVMRYRLDARGFEISTRSERMFIAWRALGPLVERRRTLFVMTGTSSAFLFPTTAGGPDRTARFRAYVARALAPS